MSAKFEVSAERTDVWLDEFQFQGYSIDSSVEPKRPAMFFAKKDGDVLVGNASGWWTRFSIPPGQVPLFHVYWLPPFF